MPTKLDARQIHFLVGDSGGYLLSHSLSLHYHRRCTVSLPCSVWERVGPVRYGHQIAERGILALGSGGAARKVHWELCMRIAK